MGSYRNTQTNEPCIDYSSIWLVQLPQTNGGGKVTFQEISEPKQSIAKSKGVRHGNKQSKQTINFAMKQDNDTLLYNMYYSLVPRPNSQLLSYLSIA